MRLSRNESVYRDFGYKVCLECLNKLRIGNSSNIHCPVHIVKNILIFGTYSICKYVFNMAISRNVEIGTFEEFHRLLETLKFGQNIIVN